jgi:hypothetical protein
MGRLERIIELSVKVNRLRERLREAEAELAHAVGPGAEDTAIVEATAMITKPEIDATPEASRLARAAAVKRLMREVTLTRRLEHLIHANPETRFRHRDLAVHLGADPETVRTLLRRLATAGRVARTDDGHWAARQDQQKVVAATEGRSDGGSE